MDNIGNRIKANHFRKTLTNGYRADSTFYKLVYRLSDEQILLSHAEHAKESAEHRALLMDYRARMSQDKPEESAVSRVMKACMAEA